MRKVGQFGQEIICDQGILYIYISLRKTIVKINYVYIIKVAVLLARCPLGGGSCDKECATVEVEDQVINNKTDSVRGTF